jgi:hypothetical protein
VALSVLPEAVSGQVTSARTVLKLDSSSVSGDSAERVGLDLLFQPLKDRIAAPDNLTEALIIRVSLAHTAAGRVALRQVFECTNPSCSSTTAVGTFAANPTWVGAAVELGTAYTLSVTLDPATKAVDFSLSGGAHAGLTARVGLAGGTPPFPRTSRTPTSSRSGSWARCAAVPPAAAAAPSRRASTTWPSA